MRVVSVNVGLPREIEWQGETVLTGIFKTPVVGRIALDPINLAGDGQADSVNHGGLGKAVYAYPVEHYPFWREFLGVDELPFGGLGENVTVEGLDEETTCVGDVLRMGDAELVVTQPREPCYKLAVRWNRKDIVRHFLMSGLSGFYLSVRRTGDLGAGDAIEFIERDPLRVPIAEVNRAHRNASADRAILERAAKHEILPEYWRKKVRLHLSKHGAQSGAGE